MPVFHTKIIESILEPVAQQVSRLVILHEEAEDGNAMPDLARPVQAVSQAVNNLVKVGHETIESSDDQLLRQDMPAALRRVENAATLLQQASDMLRADPFSGPARKKLIEGSRGILQGTSALLLCFDESEVRKIVKECRKVLDYLAVAEVIDTMEDLVQFLRDVSPALSRAAREVAARADDLTHRDHAAILARCLHQVKSLAPVLICSMKTYIHVLAEGGKGIEEASENRNYLSQRMSEEIHEIIRVLQLTSFDEDGGERLTMLAGLQAQMQAKLGAAHQWLNDRNALRNTPGERALRSVLADAQRCAEYLSPMEAAAIRKAARSAENAADTLCDERQAGRGNNPEALSLANQIRDNLHDLTSTVNEGVRTAEQQGAKSLQGRLEQAQKWLLHLSPDDAATRQEGLKAINAMVAQGQRIADGLEGREKSEILQLCSEVQSLSDQLGELCAQGQGDSPRAKQLTRLLSNKLNELKSAIERAVVNRVVEDFIDVAAPLRHFVEAVNVPEGTIGRDQNFAEKARNLAAFTDRAKNTAQIVAVGGSVTNKMLADELLTNASQMEKLSPQLISAGKIRLNYPNSKVAEEHFDNLRQQYADAVLRVRDLCDQAVNPLDFVKTAGELMQKHTYLCEGAIRNNDSQKMVDNTSAIARLANRVLLVAAQERDNTEDSTFARALATAHQRLQAAIAPAVQHAKRVALGDAAAAPAWRDANRQLLQRASDIENVFAQHYGQSPTSPITDEMSRMHVGGEATAAPPRPPPPHAAPAPPRPPPPTDATDDEGEDIFKRQPHPSQPIMGEGGIQAMDRAYDAQEKICSSQLDSNQHIWGDNEMNSKHLTSDDGGKIVMEKSLSGVNPSGEGGIQSECFFNGDKHKLDEDEIQTGEITYNGTAITLSRSKSREIEMVAAHNLHRAVRQWSSKDNEIIAAAKKMAVLMARLSELVRSDSKGSKRELIATAKAIAEASEEVTRLAKKLALECTDKRIRTNLLQVCERIPTIGTQLKILSTVKATMLGAQGSDEDQEATEMLVGNAQNLMQSVKETVKAAEGASIKIRSDQSGYQLRWVRRSPWYQI